MRNDRFALGALLVAGLAATFAIPKLLKRTRLALHRGAGITYRSGVPSGGRPAGADPSRGDPGG